MSLHAEDRDARALIRLSRDNPDPGFQRNLEAVLQVSVAANRDLYERIRRDDVMCEALWRNPRHMYRISGHKAKVRDALAQPRTHIFL